MTKPKSIKAAIVVFWYHEAVFFFISYETVTGLQYARETHRLVTDLGHDAWMWEINNASGPYPAEQIAEQIELCDGLIYLCTGPDQPWRTNGQPYERNLAWHYGKPIAVFTLEPGLVPRMLRAYTYEVFSGDTLPTQCQEFVGRLGNELRLGQQAQNVLEVEALDDEG